MIVVSDNVLCKDNACVYQLSSYMCMYFSCTGLQVLKLVFVPLWTSYFLLYFLFLFPCCVGLYPFDPPGYC